MANHDESIIISFMSSYDDLIRENHNLKSALEKKEAEIQGLNDLVAQLRRKQYGTSSEKTSSEQLGMFDEVETEALNPESVDDEKVTIPEHERKRGKRLKLPPSLPRIDVVIDIENKICPNDGEQYKCIGEEVSEKLEIIPAKVRVIRTIRKKYACPACELMTEAAAPPEMIPKSNASASVLAYIATAKYVDALPLYRQEAIFQRIGLDLSRQTMARWMIQVGDKITPLITLLREELLKSHYLHMDETIVQVLKEDGKKAQTTSYMWVQARSGHHQLFCITMRRIEVEVIPMICLMIIMAHFKLMDMTATPQLSVKMKSLVLVAGHMLAENSLMRLRVHLEIVSESKDWYFSKIFMTLKTK